MERHNLYMFRCEHKLTKRDMASKTGVSRTTYTNIESGKRDGSQAFWSTLQRVFNVPESDMFSLMKLKERKECECEETAAKLQSS